LLLNKRNLHSACQPLTGMGHW